MDHSTSMSESTTSCKTYYNNYCYSYYNRYEVAKSAIADTISELFNYEDINYNIAFGYFSSDSTLTDFYDKNSQEELLNIVSSLNVNTSSHGTNMYSSFNDAYNLLKDSTSTYKYIIMVSDGAPSCYKSGSSVTCGSQNNAYAKSDTLEIATTIKDDDAGIRIYTVGFGDEAEDLQEYLSSLSSNTSDNSSYSYTAEHPEDLEEALENIVNSITNVVAVDAYVIDIIPSSFTLNEDSKQSMYDTFGEKNVSFLTCNSTNINDKSSLCYGEEEGSTIVKINMAQIIANETTTITYRVDYNGDDSGVVFTNTLAKLEATKVDGNTYYDSEKIELQFDKPVVPIPTLTHDDDYTENPQIAGTAISYDVLSNDGNVIIDSYTDSEGNTYESTVTRKIVITSDPTCGKAEVKDNKISYIADKTCAEENDGIVTLEYQVINHVKICTSTTECKEYNIDSLDSKKKEDGTYYESSTVTIKVENKETKYKVNYIDKSTNKIIDTKEATAYIGDEVTEEYQKINGYVLVSDEKVTKTMTEEENLFEFYYLPEITITTKYVTEDGTSLSDDVIEVITYGEDYETKPASDISSYYKLKETPTNYKGTNVTEDTVVTYVYVVNAFNLTVEHINIDTNEDLISKTVTALGYGSSYETKDALDILTNYELVEEPSNKNGTITEDTTVTYYYKIKKSTVVVKYLEYGTENELSEKITKEYNYGDNYKTEESSEIESNYELKEVTGDLEEGIISKDNYEIIYWYQKKDPTLETTIEKSSTTKVIKSINEEIPYTITYKAKISDYKGEARVSIVDQLEYPIDVDKSNLDGGTYNSEDKTITWNLDIDSYDSDTSEEIKITKNIKLVYEDIDYEITEVNNKVNSKIELSNKTRETSTDYTISTKFKSKIIVHYVDIETEKEILGSKTYEDIISNILVLEPIEIEGYTLVLSPEEDEFIYTEDNHEIYYYYVKHSVLDTAEEDNPTTKENKINIIAIIINSIAILVLVILCNLKLLNNNRE